MFSCSLSQLIECPSIYELMACPNFHWQHMPALEIWRKKQDTDGDSHIVLESYTPSECIDIFMEALSDNSVRNNFNSILYQSFTALFHEHMVSFFLVINAW